MLEYPYEESIAVLENSLGNAKERLVRTLGARAVSAQCRS